MYELGSQHHFYQLQCIKRRIFDMITYTIEQRFQNTHDGNLKQSQYNAGYYLAEICHICIFSTFQSMNRLKTTTPATTKTWHTDTFGKDNNVINR